MDEEQGACQRTSPAPACRPDRICKRSHPVRICCRGNAAEIAHGRALPSGSGWLILHQRRSTPRSFGCCAQRGRGRMAVARDLECSNVLRGLDLLAGLLPDDGTALAKRRSIITRTTPGDAMKRREFLKSITVLAAGSAFPAPAIFSPARAQSRQETLLIISESGPNNLDIHGVGTIVPGYETSWNCYDRLISHDKKTLADGTEYYDRDKFVPELAEEWTVGDMSITFKLRKNATFHDGTPVTASDVTWSFERAGTVGGFPTFQMKAGSLEKAEQFVVVDDHTFRVDFIRKDRLPFPALPPTVPRVANSPPLHFQP